MTQLAVQAEGLGKRYRLGEHGYATLRERLGARPAARARENGAREIWALRDLDLGIEEGDVVGIVGRNGAGKTTLLKTVARIVRPTTGVVRVRGRVGALLEVGTGFHPELTGRENVLLNGVVLGMSRREVSRRFDAIVEFAGVERFLDTPLKRYSSGMYLRLAFAVAAHIDPDVLIVDEVLAVGDAEFRRRCLNRMSEFGREGRTVLFVSHDTGTVGQLCRRAVWLEQGRIRDDGPAHDVLDRYFRWTAPRAQHRDIELPSHSPIEGLSVRLLDGRGDLLDAPRRDEPSSVEISFVARVPLREMDVSVYVTNRQGMRLLNENLSEAEGALTGSSGPYRVRLALPPLLAADDYAVGVWIGNDAVLGFVGDVLSVSVLPLPEDRDHLDHGLVRPTVHWTVERPR